MSGYYSTAISAMHTNYGRRGGLILPNRMLMELGYEKPDSQLRAKRLREKAQRFKPYRWKHKGRHVWGGK